MDKLVVVGWVFLILGILVTLFLGGRLEFPRPPVLGAKNPKTRSTSLVREKLPLVIGLLLGIIGLVLIVI